MAVPVAVAVLPRAVLFGPRGNLTLPLFRRALGVLGYCRLHHVEGQVLLLAHERRIEGALLDADELGDLLQEALVGENGARGVR